MNRKPAGPAHHGLLHMSGQHFSCALGRAGPTVFKHEGDGATPAFYAMRPQMVYFRPDRVARPLCVLPVRAIARDDGWCDAPGHANYNMPVKLPFHRSHEMLWRDDELYDICIVLDHNRPPNARMRYRGSAIFLHCAKPGYPPTAGCIALARNDLERIVARLNTQTLIRVTR